MSGIYGLAKGGSHEKPTGARNDAHYRFCWWDDPIRGPDITVSSPANNSQVLSPVHYVASATNSNCPQGISGMRIYIASHVVAYKVQASSIDTHLTLTPGSYKTTVQAWDRCGNVSKTAVNITVAPLASSQPGLFMLPIGFRSYGVSTQILQPACLVRPRKRRS